MSKLYIFLAFILLNSSLSAQSFTEKLINRLTIHFDYNSSKVHDSDKVVLRQFIDELNVVMPYVFRIQSHTDSIGSTKFNQALSNRRSASIRKLLLELGIPEILISTKGIGEIKPIADNESEEGRLMNRRTNIFVFEIQKQRLFKSRITLKGAKSNKAQIFVYNKEKVDSTESDEQGNFAFIIPENKDVTYGVFAPGYMFSTQQINTSRDLPIESIMLNKIAKGEKINLNNLYFVGDQAVLLPESLPELTNLLRFARMNPQLKLEIGGHVNGPTSYDGDKEWYYNLALSRAKSIRQFLIKNGFQEKNYKAISYSNTQMVHPEPKSEAEAKLNRRVEIKVAN